MDTRESSLSVAVGAHVEVELIDVRGQREALTLDIVPDAAADFDLGLLGASTPLAQTILGHSAGSDLPYVRGDVRRVRILSIGPSQLATPADASARRQAALQKALEAVERTNAEIFASSFSGKWGDYDPAGMAKWDEKQTSR